MTSDTRGARRRLSLADLTRIESAMPPGAVAGTRCDSHQMKILASER